MYEPTDTKATTTTAPGASTNGVQNRRPAPADSSVQIKIEDMSGSEVRAALPTSNQIPTIGSDFSRSYPTTQDFAFAVYNSSNTLQSFASVSQSHPNQTARPSWEVSSPRGHHHNGLSQLFGLNATNTTNNCKLSTWSSGPVNDHVTQANSGFNSFFQRPTSSHNFSYPPSAWNNIAQPHSQGFDVTVTSQDPRFFAQPAKWNSQSQGGYAQHQTFNQQPNPFSFLFGSGIGSRIPDQPQRLFNSSGSSSSPWGATISSSSNNSFAHLPLNHYNPFTSHDLPFSNFPSQAHVGPANQPHFASFSPHSPYHPPPSNSLRGGHHWEPLSIPHPPHRSPAPLPPDLPPHPQRNPDRYNDGRWARNVNDLPYASASSAASVLFQHKTNSRQIAEDDSVRRRREGPRYRCHVYTYNSEEAAAVHGDEDDDECVICLEDFKQNDRICRLPCKHEYHQNCIEMWLKSHDNCPFCLRKVSLRPHHQHQPY